MSERIAVVEAVNDDGTVTVSIAGQTLPPLPADPSYVPRAIGDRVRVRMDAGQAFVLGKGAGDLPKAPLTTAPPPGWTHTLVDAAPAAPYEQAASVWVNPYTKDVQYVRAAAAPPAPAATSGTVTHAVAQIGTYRGGRLIRDTYAEQGTWGGYGPDQGVMTYGSWSALSGKTITAVRVTLHRMNEGGIIAAVPIYIGRHNLGSLPSATPALAEVSGRTTLARNETKTIALPTEWGAMMRDGTAAGIGIYHASYNAQLDIATIAVDWSA